MLDQSLAFPTRLYPAFAPLPVPMADHLLRQEQRRYRRRPTKSPTPDELTQTVLARISQARTIVYEYMNPYILAERERHQRGESRTFPDPDWLLDSLAQYTPQHKKNDQSSLDYWQKKGLLRREKKRGRLESTSVAALLIARLSLGLSEVTLQRNFLPAHLSEAEPRWWCYGRTSPEAPLQSLPVPLVGRSLSSLVIWTPWQGAVWDEGIWEQPWQTIDVEGTSVLYQWASSPSLHDLSVWNKELPEKIQSTQEDKLFGRKAVQEVLLQEAKKDILVSIAKKEEHCHEYFIG